MSYEVIIVGAGPAAWAAAIYLARIGIKTLVIGRQEDSGLFDAADVWNYPGFEKGLTGRALLDKMATQALSQGTVFKKDEVTHIEKIFDSTAWVTESDRFFIRTADRSEFRCRFLLLAHGANYIKVDLPGEAKYRNKGVHYCALCDGPMYKGKDILVIGNGNFAAEEAIQLTAFSPNGVRIITHASEPNFSPDYLSALRRYGVTVINQRVTEIVGVQGLLTGVRVEPPVSRHESLGATLAYDANAVFIAIGVASSPAFSKQLGLETHGNFLKADNNMRTNAAGVWVAGLARGGVNQIVKSVGDGGVAAVDIIKTLKDIPQYIDHA